MEHTSEAYDLLRKLGAPNRLIRHGRFVAEAAEEIMRFLVSLGIVVDETTVRLGAVLHDCGKTLHQNELSEAGSHHEKAGGPLLLAHGVQDAVAKCCRSHGAWSEPEVSLEERIVALADKLWKGKREDELELLIIDEVAVRTAAQRWEVFSALDTTFETIAADGSRRLELSKALMEVQD